MSFTMQFLFLSSFTFIIALVILKSLYFSSKPNKNLPPSPPKLPIIGNLHQLGSSPHHFLQALSQTYGPLMLLHFGTVRVLVASSADAAREIMKTHDLIFSNRPKLKIPCIVFYGPKDIAFTQYGEHWRKVKSIVVLHLLTNKRVQSYQHIREEELALMMKNIQEAHNSVVNLSELLFTLTNNVFCRLALGRIYDGAKFKDRLERFLEVLGCCFTIGNYIPWLTWVDRLSGLEQRADEVAKEYDEFFENVFEEHETNKVVGAKSQDLLDVLFEVQKDNSTDFHLGKDAIKAIILDIFASGTFTTFMIIEWAISELLRHPHAMKKLQLETREIGQGKPVICEDDLKEMAYLKAVLKETLRLHTPVPLLVPRESTEDTRIFGYDIPSGTQVIINAWAIAKDPLIWEEPNEFRPERFLNNSIDYKGLHFELIPFGAGRRGCPGIHFGMIINEVVLANLVYKFDMKLAGEEDLDMSEIAGITLNKKCPVLVTTNPCS